MIVAMAKLSPTKLRKLKDYFAKREDVAFAFLFGSYAKGTATRLSDADIGVYFKPAGPDLEYEESREYPAADEIKSAVHTITGTTAEVVILNQASCLVADGIVRKGVALVVNDHDLHWHFFLFITGVATDFRWDIKDYNAIRRRSIFAESRVC